MNKKHTMELSSNRDFSNGELTISDVKILAAGTWNGVVYTANELERSLDHWRDNSLFDRHYEQTERDESNRVGYITDKRFEDNAIVGNLVISNAEVIKNIDDYNGISVEHVYDNYDGKIDISFLGAALVPVPACSVCQLNKEIDKMENGKIDKLSDQVAELAKEVDKLTKVDVDAVVTEQSRKDSKVINGLTERITELEKQPVQNTTVVSGIVDSYADIVHSNGETYRRD